MLSSVSHRSFPRNLRAESEDPEALSRALLALGQMAHLLAPTPPRKRPVAIAPLPVCLPLFIRISP